MYRTQHRWLALLAVVALVLGFAAYGVAAASMDAKMMTAAATGEMAPASGCDGCGSADAGTAACYVLFCSGTAAILPGEATLKAVAPETIASLAFPSQRGRSGAPDPYPPRPAILS